MIGADASVGELADLPVVWHPDVLHQEPSGEVWHEIWEQGTEVPERPQVLLQPMKAAGATVTDARPIE